MRPAIMMLAAAAIPIIAASNLQAQTAETARLQAFTRTPFYTSLLNRGLAAIPKTVFQRCPTLVSKGSQVTVIKPVSFGADGFPNAGSWRQRFPVSGCGNDTMLNLFFFAGGDEKINTVIGLPGTTAADLVLQRDGPMYAYVGAKLVAKDCKVFDVKNTKFEGFGLSKPPLPDPGPGKPRRPWRETWTVIGCGHTINVPMDFVPDEKGTQIIQPGGAVEQ